MKITAKQKANIRKRIRGMFKIGSVVHNAKPLEAPFLIYRRFVEVETTYLLSDARKYISEQVEVETKEALDAIAVLDDKGLPLRFWTIL